MKKEKKASIFSASTINSFIYLFNKYSFEKLSIKDNDIEFTISKEVPAEAQASSLQVSEGIGGIKLQGGVAPYSYRDVIEQQDEREVIREEAKKSLGEDKKGHYKVVLAPVVGTFYRSSSPDNPPFVSEGSLVNAESTLCIIEAMKMMNEIKAESSGRIVKILVSDASAVKEGQELFYIEP